MARDFFIAGEALVLVTGGPHLSGDFQPVAGAVEAGAVNSGHVAELGLAFDSIKVAPKLHHHDIYTNDFGPRVPVNVLTQCQYTDIDMTLIHYDADILDVCWAESIGGLTFVAGDPGTNDVIRLLQAGCGTLLGNGRQLNTSGNRLLTLDITAQHLSGTWTFPACYLVSEPFVYPVGTKATQVELRWRSIPYRAFNRMAVQEPGVPVPSIRDVTSSGVILWEWNRELETIEEDDD